MVQPWVTRHIATPMRPLPFVSLQSHLFPWGCSCLMPIKTSGDDSTRASYSYLTASHSRLYARREIHNTHSYKAADFAWVLPADILFYLGAFHNQSHPRGGQGWLPCGNLLQSEKSVILFIERSFPSTSMWPLCKGKVKLGEKDCLFSCTLQSCAIIIHRANRLLWWFGFLRSKRAS